jgi:hypothetical protein
VEISLTDVTKVIRRFKNEIQFSQALFWLEMTYHMEGPKKAMLHARRIAAAYTNLRVSRELEMSL